MDEHIISVSVRRKSSPAVLWTVEHDWTLHTPIAVILARVAAEYPDMIHVVITVD